MKNLQKILVAILPIMAACVAENPEYPDVRKDAMELFVEPAFCWNGIRTQSASFYGPEGIVLEDDAARTKVSFSGKDENGTAVSETSQYERIDWKADNSEYLRMLFYDENGQLLAGEDEEYCVNKEYKIKRMLSGVRETNLPWTDGQGENRVFAVYPSSASLSYSRSSNTLTLGNVHLASSIEEGYESDFADPDTIKVWPKSGQMYLYGGLSVPAGAPKGQSICFQPMFNAVQLLISPPADPTSVFYGAKLLKVSLLSQDKSALAGKNATVTVTDATDASASWQRSTDKLTVNIPDKDASDEIVLAFSSGEAPYFDRPLDITLLTFPRTYDKLTLQLEFEKNGSVFAAAGDLSRTGGAFLPATKTRITNQSDPGNAFTFEVRKDINNSMLEAVAKVVGGNRVPSPFKLTIDSFKADGSGETFLDWTTEQWDSTARRWVPLNHDNPLSPLDTLSWIDNGSFPWKNTLVNPTPKNNAYNLYAWDNRVRREWEGPVGDNYQMYGNNASSGSAHDLSAHDIFGNPNQLDPHYMEIQQKQYALDVKNQQDWIDEIYATYTPEEIEDFNNWNPGWNIIPTFEQWLQRYTEVTLFTDGKIHETANCYVVSAPGYYTFPMIAGNGVNGKLYLSGYNYPAMGYSQGMIGRDSGQNHFLEMGKHRSNGFTGASAVPLWYYDYSNYDYVTGEYARVEEQMTSGDRYVWNTLYAFPGYDNMRMQENCSSNNKSNIPLFDESKNLITYTADVLWQDIKDLISDVSVTNTSGLYNESTVPMVTFKVNGERINQGNAVIAARNANGEIVWSWHIWIMERQKLKVFDIGLSEMLGMSVGFCEGDFIPQPSRDVILRFTQNGSGLRRTLTLTQAEDPGPFYNAPYYQWGRKDPLNPAYASSHVSYPKIFYDGNGSSFTAFKVKTYANTKDLTMGQMIQNPDIIYACNKADYTDADNAAPYQRALLNLWDSSYLVLGTTNKTTKTVYDPCPPGFCVPGVASVENYGTPEKRLGYDEIEMPCVERGDRDGTSDKARRTEFMRFPHLGYMGTSNPAYSDDNARDIYRYGEGAYFSVSGKSSWSYAHEQLLMYTNGTFNDGNHMKNKQGIPVIPVRDTHRPVTGAGVRTNGQNYYNHTFGNNYWND